MARLTLLQQRRNIATKGSVSFSKCYDDTSFQDMSGSAGHLGSDAKIHAQTGYPACIIDHLWDKYKSCLDEFRPKRGKDRTKCYFYELWCWIHSGCNARNICRTLFTPQTGFISETTFRVRLKPMMAKIACAIDEIDWENRLQHDNHSLFFPKLVTGIVVRNAKRPTQLSHCVFLRTAHRSESRLQHGPGLTRSSISQNTATQCW